MPTAISLILLYVVSVQVDETVETLDCGECNQLSQEAFISIARTPVNLPRLRRLVVPTDLTLPNAVFEALANSDCLPLLQSIDNIQPGSSVCDPLRCQVIVVGVGWEYCETKTEIEA